MYGEVLVLNHDYQPLNITSARRAVVLVFLQKAHSVEWDSAQLRSEHLLIEVPTVVRLNYFVRRPVPQLKPTRKAIFARDEHTCQYCGATGVSLTIDHVRPREQGGGDDWDNLVCCCVRCNNVKANRSPARAGLNLRRVPQRPKLMPYISFTKFMRACRNPQWREYLGPYLPRNGNGKGLPP